jgi:hypothetical protein
MQNFFLNHFVILADNSFISRNFTAVVNSPLDRCGHFSILGGSDTAIEGI